MKTNFKDILKGHVNEIMKSEEELYQERISICKECPLFKETSLGPICNSNLYLDNNTGTVYTNSGDNRTRGCGCRLNAKTRLPDSRCPVGSW